MKKNFAKKVSVLIILMIAVEAFADAPLKGPWKFEIETGLGLTQAYYNDAWVGGESGSITWVSSLNAKAERQFSEYWHWANDLKLAFGQTHTQVQMTDSLGRNSYHWQKPKKSTDKIRFDTILKLTRSWFADPYAAVTFESQFLDQADPNKKRYVNPVDLTETVGLSKTIFNVEDVRSLATRVGFGFKQRFITFTDPTNANAEISESSNQGGFEWVTDYTLGSAKTRYGFTSKFTVFQALMNSEDPPVDDWKTADLNWDNSLRANLTSVLQATLAWQLLYDKEISSQGRFKQTLALGFGYKFAASSEVKN